MAVTLAANKYPAGTRPGSPITEIDAFSDVGGADSIVTFPISKNAQAGDVVIVWLASVGGSLGPFSIYPTGAWTWNYQQASNASQFGGLCALNLFSHVVLAGEPGTEVSVTWPGSHDFWVRGRCLRYVDPFGIFNKIGSGYANGAGISTSANTGVLGGTPTVSGCLISAAMAIYLDSNAGAAAFLFQVGMYNQGVATGAFAPLKLGLVDGYIDRAQAIGTGGATSAWNNPGGGNTALTGAAAGSMFAMAPVPVPAAPSVTLTPSGSSIDAAAASGTPFQVVWTYTPVRNQGSQEAWLIARQPHAGGAATFWNADSAIWQAAEYWNLGPPAYFQFPASAWVDDGTNWDLYVAITESALHLKSALAGPFTFTADNPPSVTAVSITNPNTSTPTVSWTSTLPRAPQTKYQVWVYSSDQIAAAGFVAGTTVPRWGSGLVTSAATSVVTGALTGGGTYTAYLQLTQTGGQVTPILPATSGSYVNASTATWYAGFSAPAQPTITVVAQNDPGTGAPTIAVTVTGHDVGGFAGTGTTLVQFSDDQVTWTTLRNAASLPLTTLSGQVATVSDFEAFQNKIRYYRAVVNNTSGGVAVSSAVSATVSATATSSPPSAWFVAPLNPSVSTAAEVEGVEQTQLEQLAPHWGLGRSDPIVLFDVVNYKDGKLTIKTINAAQDAAIDALIAQQATLWFTTPFGEGYYIRLGPEPGGESTTSGAKVRTTTLEPSYIANPVRKTIIPYIVVKRP